MSDMFVVFISLISEIIMMNYQQILQMDYYIVLGSGCVDAPDWSEMNEA